MSTIAQTVRDMSRNLATVLFSEPAIRPDFRLADHTTITAVILCLIGKGIDSASSIFRYLNNRACILDKAAIEHLLNQYDGGDTRHCLWRRLKTGHYTPL